MNKFEIYILKRGSAVINIDNNDDPETVINRIACSIEDIMESAGKKKQ